jgi:nucleoside triphosphate pyrophosphatase
MILILASNSPRRAEILSNAGFAFEMCSMNIDESPRPRESGQAHVLRLATAKAQAAARHIQRQRRAAIVVGADTVVLARGKIFGKPRDANDARRMLRLLSGRMHQVLTGVSIVRLSGGKELHHVESTRVHFVKLLSDDIETYIATGEPFDKAGAYGIQGIGGRFVDRLDGCYFNVMGLPLSRVSSMLRGLGYAGLSAARR